MEIWRHCVRSLDFWKYVLLDKQRARLKDKKNIRWKGNLCAPPGYPLCVPPGYHSNRGASSKRGHYDRLIPLKRPSQLTRFTTCPWEKPIVLYMPTDPGTFCCIALGRGVFFWQNDRRLCPRAGEMEMSSTEMAKRWASHVLVAFFPSQKIKDRKCLQKSQDNHDFLPVTSISSGFKTRDLWWHDSFQALEKVPVCLELCPSFCHRSLPHTFFFPNWTPKSGP